MWRWTTALAAMACTQTPGPPAEITPTTSSCALPDGLVSIGTVTAVVDGPAECELLVSGCADDGDCPWWESPLRRLGVDATELGTIADAVSARWVLDTQLVLLESDGALSVRGLGGDLRTLHSDVQTAVLVGSQYLAVTTTSGSVRQVAIDDGSSFELSPAAEVLRVTEAPPGVLLLETVGWDAPSCNDRPRGELSWVDLQTAERWPIASDASAVLAVHEASQTLVHDVVDLTGERTFVVGSLTGPDAGQSFRTLPPWEDLSFGGCGGEELSADLSPDGTTLAWRETRLEYETGGFVGLYPDLELQVVRRDGLTEPPVLVPCGPSSYPTVMDDGVLCNDHNGLGVYDEVGDFTVIAPEVGQMIHIGDRQWVLQAYDDDAPLVDDVFRAAELTVLDLDAASSDRVTPLVDGYLVDVHHSRWAVFSERPESWLTSRPEDIHYSVLDLQDSVASALPGALRPEGVLDRGAVVLYAPWGTSEHDPGLGFVGPMP